MYPIFEVCGPCKQLKTKEWSGVKSFGREMPIVLRTPFLRSLAIFATCLAMSAKVVFFATGLGEEGSGAPVLSTIQSGLTDTCQTQKAT